MLHVRTLSSTRQASITGARVLHVRTLSSTNPCIAAGPLRILYTSDTICTLLSIVVLSMAVRAGGRVGCACEIRVSVVCWAGSGRPDPAGPVSALRRSCRTVDACARTALLVARRAVLVGAGQARGLVPTMTLFHLTTVLASILLCGIVLSSSRVTLRVSGALWRE